MIKETVVRMKDTRSKKKKLSSNKKETENEREMDDRNDLEKTLEGHQ